MNYFLRNNQTDFEKWYKDVVPRALFVLSQFSESCCPILMREEYEDALRVKRQLYAIETYLDENHLYYFRNVMMKHLPRNRNPVEYALYDDIFHIWQAVVFPKGKYRIKDVDPILIGGTLKRIRKEKCLSAKQVAQLVRISDKSLYAYEEGTREMRINTLHRLCQIYKTSEAEIIEKAEVVF